MLVDHYRNTVSVSRKTVTGRQTTFEEVDTGVTCHIQPTEGITAPGEAGRGDRTFLVFTQYELQNGDRLTDESLVEYEVYGVMRETFRGKSHTEAFLRAV